jgi:hypothetical protein
MQQHSKNRYSDMKSLMRPALLALGATFGLTLGAHNAPAQDTSRAQEVQGGDWLAVDQAWAEKARRSLTG